MSCVGYLEHFGLPQEAAETVIKMKNELESICHSNCGAVSSKAGTRAGNGRYHFCSALMVCPPSDETCVTGLRHAPGMCRHFYLFIFFGKFARP